MADAVFEQGKKYRVKCLGRNKYDGDVRVNTGGVDAVIVRVGDRWIVERCEFRERDYKNHAFLCSLARDQKKRGLCMLNPRPLYNPKPL